MIKLAPVAALVFMIAQMLTTTLSSTTGRNVVAERVAPLAPSVTPTPEAEAQTPERCTEREQVIATMADGYIAFVSASPIHAGASEWPAEQMNAMERIYGEVILDGYAGLRGFGSVAAWAQAFGIAQVPAGCPGPDCCNAGAALRFLFVPDMVNRAGWYDFPGIGRVPAVQTACSSDNCPPMDVAYHELAHLWDFRHNAVLSSALDRAMEVDRDADRRVDVDHYYGRKAADAYLPTGQPPITRHGDFASTYFSSVDPTMPPGVEHFAVTVAAYFLIEQGAKYDFPPCWVDEDPRCPPDRRYEYDRCDFMEELFGAARARGQAWS